MASALCISRSQSLASEDGTKALLQLRRSSSSALRMGALDSDAMARGVAEAVLPLLRARSNSGVLLRKPSLTLPAQNLSASAVATLPGVEEAAPVLKGAAIMAATSVFPPIELTQEDYLQGFLRTHKLTPADVDFVTRVFRATTIETCRSYLPKERLFEKMTRSQYVDYVKPALYDLATRAGEQALQQWGGDRQDITHVVWGTMTGTIHAPSMDVLLVPALGLSHKVKRLSVESMGCLTGFRCLNTASELAMANPRNKVLVVVCDIRSALQNQLTPHEDYAPVDRANVIVTALFRDSGGAAIVCHPSAVNTPAAPAAAPTVASKPAEQQLAAAVPRQQAAAAPLFEVLDGMSYVVPETNHLVRYREYDDATIHLFIHKDLPGRVKQELPALVSDLLAPHGLSAADCSYAVHTGGPKVIEGVAAALGIKSDTMGASWHVMQKYGNLSGASNLVVLDHMARMAAAGDPSVQRRPYTICISIGPGACIELALLRNLAWSSA